MSQNSSLDKVALPYAEALFNLSQSAQLIDENNKHLSFVAKNIKQSDRLKSMLEHPLLGTEAKKTVLTKLFGSQINSSVLNFLYILIDRRRISLIQPISRCYFDLVNRLQLVLLAEVTTAIPLSTLQKQALQNKLKHMTNSSTIKIIEQVNPELIGGLIIRIGSRVIDMSICGQLSQISSYLNGSQL